MGVLVQPGTLLLIIVAGYLLKRAGVFGANDYRVVQAAEFNLVLPGAIIYSFATNPHHVSFLLISLFGLIAALIPPLCVFFTSRHTPVANRAFRMLNVSGFNIGCFSFPMLQALIGPQVLVAAAMFDIGNTTMVAAGTTVMTQSLLRIKPGIPLPDQHPGSAPTLPADNLSDSDARRLHRRSLLRGVAKGFFGSPSFDVYLLMVAFMLAGINLPGWVALVSKPFAGANAFCSMLMVGMLMDLPACRDDFAAVGKVLAWRLPCGVAFAAAAWFLLPFDPLIRQAVALCCLSPTAIFATMYTDKVLGNAKLAGFTLALTAVISTFMMVAAHLLLAGL
ncbi:permease [Bombiscardovia apis]|uniref:Permease n=1 Tax=Bombiscardovia apis TaxID=2932182 RepID=A0ABN6SHX1_9BIFI|nr:AEC family transporter [Bombiscardovia apis]BDR54245.1 permease [Bombiscardovia apis]